jgi:hypothetical protein
MVSCTHMDIKCKICQNYSNANQRFRPWIVSEHREIWDVWNLTTGCFMNCAIYIILQMKFSLEMSPVLKYKFVKRDNNAYLFVFPPSLICCEMRFKPTRLTNRLFLNTLVPGSSYYYNYGFLHHSKDSM